MSPLPPVRNQRWACLVLGTVGAATIAVDTLLTPAQAAALTHWAFDPATVQLEVTVAEGTQPRYFLMAQPARIVLDLPNTQVGAVTAQQTYAGAIRQVRVSQFQPGVARIVLELSPEATLAPGQVKLEKVASGGRDRWVLRPLVANAAIATRANPSLQSALTAVPQPLQSDPAAATEPPPPAVPLAAAQPPTPDQPPATAPTAGGLSATPLPGSVTAAIELPMGGDSAPVESPSVPLNASPTPNADATPADIALSAPPVNPDEPGAADPPIAAPADATSNSALAVDTSSGVRIAVPPPAVTPTPPQVPSSATSTADIPMTLPAIAATPQVSVPPLSGAAPISAPIPGAPEPPIGTAPPLAPPLVAPPLVAPPIVAPPLVAPQNSPARSAADLQPPSPVTPPVGDLEIPSTLPSLSGSGASGVTADPSRMIQVPMLETGDAAPPTAVSAPPLPVSGSLPGIPDAGSAVPPVSNFPAETELPSLSMPPLQSPDTATVTVPPLQTAPELSRPTVPSLPVEPTAIAAPSAIPAPPAIEFGNPLPPVSPPPAIAYGTQATATNLLLPPGMVLNLRYPGSTPLKLDAGTPRQEVLFLEQEIRDAAGTVLVPAGSAVIGRFETSSAGSRFVTQAITAQGLSIPLMAQSASLGGDRKPGEQSLIRNSGIGALAGGILGGISGLLGGAATGAAFTYLTAPKPATIQPGQVVPVQVMQPAP